MATADHGGPTPDLYQLLGVPREASREEIVQAWRRRARDEHPDRRLGEAADEAAGRFRVLAEAYQVLGDPGRRVAYDRVLAREQPPVAPVPPAVPSAGPPLRAGPVWIEDGPRPARRAGSHDEEDVRLAELLLRYLAREGVRPW